MVKYCIVALVIQLFVVTAQSRRPGPLIIATKGGIWPKPQQQVVSQKYFVLRPRNFKFTVVKVSTSCSLLESGLENYFKILQQNQLPTERERKQQTNQQFKRKWLQDEEFLGYLDALAVNLTQQCSDNEYPSLEMDESYKLWVTMNKTELQATSVWGILRGLESFSQIVYLGDDGFSLRVNSTTIKDFPRYKHRGLLIDTSRHFIPLEKIYLTLDALAYNKMNVLHWHIVDDESYPYVSQKFPELREQNADVTKFMKKHNIITYNDLEGYYIQKIIDMVENLGYYSIVWEEVFSNGVKLPNKTFVHVWKGGWTDTMKEVTSAGKYGLLSACWYLDGLESGGDWDRFYNCDPADFGGTPKEQKLVFGGEACMWGEVVNEYNIISRVWPRASATAEKLWSAYSKNYSIEEPQRRLEEHTCRMNRRGIGAQPPNGAGYCD